MGNDLSEPPAPVSTAGPSLSIAPAMPAAGPLPPARTKARPTPMHKPTFPTPVLPDDLRSQGVFVNLEGDYTYLSDGYYRSMEAEHEGLLALPSPQEAIDAYVVPLALTKAQAAGIPIPSWEISNDSTTTIEPPLVAYPINPFQDEGIVIADSAAMGEAVKSLTMSNKYAVVCQDMQPDSRVDTLRLVLGKCLKPEYADLADKLWRTFRLPLARVKVIVTEKQYLFSAIEPLKKEELTQNEKAIIKEAGLWRA
jgi:hypothetical protein